MNKHSPMPAPLAVLLFAAGLLAAPCARAQGAPLTPPAARITDEAMQADLRSYEALQTRVRGLNERGRPLGEYFLAKSQCWLDASWHEYTRNDRSEFPQAALTQAATLIAAMERGVTPDRETPLVAGATRLRPDLWSAAAKLKDLASLSCAQHKLACAEVELVHAGHEDRQLGWRHAQPYVQIAEELMAQAQLLADRCPPAIQRAPMPRTDPALPASARP